MNAKKKTVIGIGGIALVIAIGMGVGYATKVYALPQEPLTEEQIEKATPVWQTEGYGSEGMWSKALNEGKSQQLQACDILLVNYKDLFSEEEVQKIEGLKNTVKSALTFEQLHPCSLMITSYRETAEKREAEKKAKEEAEEAERIAQEEAAAQAQAAAVNYNYNYTYDSDYNYTPAASTTTTTSTTTSYSNGDGLTKSSGVNYYDGRRETYYSSNALYHYRTSEWTVDSEGFYRTADGNYVVAASDKAQGTTFEGSKGTCEVLDSGCASGTTDYYTAW